MTMQITATGCKTRIATFYIISHNFLLIPPPPHPPIRGTIAKRWNHYWSIGTTLAHQRLTETAHSAISMPIRANHHTKRVLHPCLRGRAVETELKARSRPARDVERTV